MSKRGVTIIVESGTGCWANEENLLLSLVAKVAKQTRRTLIPFIVEGGTGRSRYATCCRGWHELFDVFRWKAWALHWNMMACDKLSLRLYGEETSCKTVCFRWFSVKQCKHMFGGYDTIKTGDFRRHYMKQQEEVS